MDRHVVIISGAGGNPFNPQLIYAAHAAERRGATVHWTGWTMPEDLDDWSPEKKGLWLEERVEPVLRELGASRPLLVGFSLGARASRLAASNELPAIWLAPGLRDNWNPDALRKATAPCLLVGGSDDPIWDSELAPTLSPCVVEIPGANHAFIDENSLAASVAILGIIVLEIKRFLDAVVWPG